VNEIRDESPTDEDEGGVKVRLIALGVVAVILGIFIIQNTSSQEIEFLGFSSSPPLWVSLTLAAIGGAIVGQLALWAYRRSRRQG